MQAKSGPPGQLTVPVQALLMGCMVDAASPNTAAFIGA